MRFTVLKTELIAPLMAVAGVVPSRPALPILANVLVRCRGESITLVTTDLEIEARAQAVLKSGADGEFTMPARKALEICRNLPDDAVIDIAVETSKMTLKAGKSRFTLATSPPADFPGVEASDWMLEIKLSASELRKLLEKTQFCVAHQDVRYYLNGVLLDIEKNLLRAVGTDGHRMGTCEVAIEGVQDLKPRPAASQDTGDADTSGGHQAILPRKGVQEMVHMLADMEGTVVLRLSANHVGVFGERMTLISKLIEGRYPDYRRVIPANQPIHLRLDREQLRAALGRAAILANEKYHGVGFELGKNQLRLSARNPEQEEAVEEVAIEYSGEGVDIGFNVSYLRDALAAVESETVEIGLSNKDTGCVIRAPDDERNQYVVMPMRI